MLGYNGVVLESCIQVQQLLECWAAKVGVV